MNTKFRRFLGIICLLLLLGPTMLNAKCKCGKPPKENPSEEKVYINSNEIAIYGEQIFVKLENEAVVTPALYTDERGMYILAKRGRDQGNCPDDYWECSTCRGCTAWYSPDCDWCGYN